MDILISPEFSGLLWIVTFTSKLLILNEMCHTINEVNENSRLVMHPEKSLNYKVPIRKTFFLFKLDYYCYGLLNGCTILNDIF